MRSRRWCWYAFFVCVIWLWMNAVLRGKVLQASAFPRSSIIMTSVAIFGAYAASTHVLDSQQNITNGLGEFGKELSVMTLGVLAA